MKLKPKELQYVKARVRGMSKRAAAIQAGASTPIAADQYANRMSKNVKINQAIEEALQLHELTPEHAVRELKKIVDQDKELGAKRLAIKDTLELHGWQRGERPTSVLAIQNAFFNNSRPHPQQPTHD